MVERMKACVGGATKAARKVTVSILSLAVAFALTACDTRIGVQATANTPVQYSHVYVTVEQVWVNASATAAPGDTTWLKFPLTASQTLDLVGLDAGALTQFASQLSVPTGEYKQLRLILSDTDGSLASSAQTAGAKFNNEVDYFDTSNARQQLPLIVASSAIGVGVAIDLKVLPPSKAALAALAASKGTSSPNSASSSSTLYNSTTATTSTTSSTSTFNKNATTTSDANATGLGSTTATAAVIFDATRDIVPFLYSDQPAFVLNAQLKGYDLAKVGTIRSQVIVSSLTFDANANRPDVQVTAEVLSTDGTRNVPVMSTPLRADGTFVLYPFPMEDNSPTTYDLVIHGPGIQTVIVKAVPVNKGTPTSAATVSLGSLTLKPVTSYLVNVSDTNTVATRGSHVGFYQTLNGTNEVPYLIEEYAVDPLTGQFVSDPSVPIEDILLGQYSKSQTLTYATTTPTQGTGGYQVALSAPVYGDGAFGATITPPPGAANTTRRFDAPTLGVPTTATAGTITATLSVTSPGKYDNGALVVTHDGALISLTVLDTVLAQASGTTTVSSIPAGSATQPFDAGVYYAEVWAWNSSDPAGTFLRQPATDAIDLRATNAASPALTLN